MSTTPMSTVAPSRMPDFLRRVLSVDAASTAVTGVLLLVSAGALVPWLGLPAGLVRTVGAIYLVFAAYIALVITRLGPWRQGAWIVVACNAIWCVDSLLLLASGRVQPTALGTGFVLAQAAFAAVIGVLETVGLRRARPGAAQAARAAA